MESKKPVTKTAQGLWPSDHLLGHIPPLLQVQGLPPSLGFQPQLLALKGLLLHSSLSNPCVSQEIQGHPAGHEEQMSFAQKKAEEQKMKRPWDWHLKRVLLPIFLMDPQLSSQKLSWVPLNKKNHKPKFTMAFLGTIWRNICKRDLDEVKNGDRIVLGFSDSKNMFGITLDSSGSSLMT